MASRGNRVAIVGVGYSKVGRRSGLSLEELTAQAAKAAMDDAGIKPQDIDGVAAHSFPNQYTPATSTASMLGLPPLSFFSGSIDGPAYVVAALHAMAAIASGSCHTCLTIRTVHQMGAADNPLYAAGGDNQFLAPFGVFTAAQWAGMFMRRNMAEYGTKEEDFGALAVAQREYASMNDDALFRDRITLDDYLSARYVSKPCRLLDCDYPVDSSSALIFTTEERARNMRKKPVFADSWSFSTSDVLDFHLIENMTHSSPWTASEKMWAKTDLKPADLDVAGLYDGFTFIAMQWLEALGVCGEGESGPFVSEGNTRLGGKLPTNTDGGACNVGRRHGANFFIEVTRQLRGECGERQVPNAKVGVASNAVGVFAGCALLTAD